MGMPQPIADWTVERVLKLPDDGNRYEAVDGQLLVTPAPSPLHQLAVQALYERLAPFVRAHRIGRVLLSPADIEFDERTLVQPDLFVAPLVEGRQPRSTPGWSNAGACPTSGRRCWPSDSSGTLPRRSRPFPSTSPSSSPRFSTSKGPPYARAAAP
jgi:hypothetical protein